jgi:hypothetical protein
MAVAKLQKLDGSWTPPRNIHPPKEASIKGWYNSCQKLMLHLPKWRYAQVQPVTVDAESIILEVSVGTLYISRKEWL